MYKNCVVYFALLITLSSCANEPKRHGIPDWDYERDELKIGLGAIIGAAVGAVVGERGGVSGSALGGLVRDEVGLSPGVLNRLLLNTLTNSTSVATNFSTTSTLSNAKTESKWEVSESSEGQIITDWKPIPGRKAGLGWWEKEYQTEVRHIITVKRSYRSSKNSNFSILTEVRERPNSNYKWDKADPELGRTSFEEIKSILLASVHKTLTENGAAKPNED